MITNHTARITGRLHKDFWTLQVKAINQICDGQLQLREGTLQQTCRQVLADNVDHSDNHPVPEVTGHAASARLYQQIRVLLLHWQDLLQVLEDTSGSPKDTRDSLP
jgi:hypothetical protein